MASLVQLTPTGAIRKTTVHSNCWEAVNGRAWFDITSPNGVFLSGWTLLSGVLNRRTGDFDARLQCDIGQGFVEGQFFEIPASGKGVIKELICLPAGIKRMRFSPMGTGGEFELGSLTFKKIGAWERRWRMIRRIMPMIFLHSSQKRKIIKLNFFRMLHDLKGTYEIAGKLRAHSSAPLYKKWVKQFDVLTNDDRIGINKHIARFPNILNFHLLVVFDSGKSNTVHQTLASFNAQLYRHYTCVLLDMAESDDWNAGMHEKMGGVIRVAKPHQAAWFAQLHAAIENSRDPQWVLLVRAGDVLAPHALYQFASVALANPSAAVLYSDEDTLNENGERSQPRFKPNWSSAHFNSTNFVGDSVAIRGSELVEAGGLNIDCCRRGRYDLLLRVVDVLGDSEAGKVVHIPAVLLHRNMEVREIGLNHDDWNEPEWCMEALRAHLVRASVKADVLQTRSECWRIRFHLPNVPPLVSIIVPLRDALNLTRQCVESLLKKTTYPSFEILMVDNQSTDPDTLAYLKKVGEHKKVRILSYEYPFNYSAINNIAVKEARGDVVCLLNNDTEVITPGWLDEMVGHLLQPQVGVVGAKLYFADDSIQHGGDLVGVGGVANHAHAFLERDDAGYCDRAVVAQELSAVTAACLVTWKKIYQQLDGMEEKYLKVAFNDVDYCLRVRKAGYRVVWTPHAELHHYESVSRGKDLSPEKVKRAKREVEYMRKRWKRELQRDPFYNPNLSYERPDFSLSNAPIIERPWQT